MRHSLNKLIMWAWSKTKLNMDLWKWHMNLIKARASKWPELNHWPDSCMCFDFTAETSKPSTLWGLPDSTVPPPPTDYKAASCLFGSNYRKHCWALFGKVQTITSPTVVQSPGVWSGGSRLAQKRGLPQTQTGVPTQPSHSISPWNPTQQETPDPSQTLSCAVLSSVQITNLMLPPGGKNPGVRGWANLAFCRGVERKMQFGWSTISSLTLEPKIKVQQHNIQEFLTQVRKAQFGLFSAKFRI